MKSGKAPLLRLFFAAVTLALCLEQSSLAQSRQNFTLFGDIKVDDTQIEERKPITLDVLLYKGGALISRHRVGNFGRYRFMNLLAGMYEVAIEIENVEVVRLSKLIAGQYADDVRLDISLVWRPLIEQRAGKAGIISVADSYSRSHRARSLFQKSSREIESKNYIGAIATLRTLVTSDPKDFPAWVELGMVHYIRKDFDEAEMCFLSATEAQPTYFPALFNLGRVRLAMKNYEAAIQPLEAALKINSTSGVTNYFLGEAYLQMKKGSIAVGYLNQALRLDPIGMADAHLRLATLYNGAGLKEAAIGEYEQFLKKRPDYSDRKRLEQYISDNKKR